MKSVLLEILACPKCGHSVELNDPVYDGPEIIEGYLQCCNCASKYNILQGVPCMLVEPEEITLTQKGFTEQWEMKRAGKFNIEFLYGLDYERYGNYISEKKLISSDDSGWYLDAGCGSGALPIVISQQNPNLHVIGMDFQNDIYSTAAAAKGNDNLHFVHGDVLNPPFKKESLQLLTSHGVLHHTADTEKAFSAVSSLVRKGGAISVWLYPDFFECGYMMKVIYIARDFIFMKKGHLLSAKKRYALSKLAVAVLAPFFILFGIVDLIKANRKLKEINAAEQSVLKLIPVAQNLELKEFFQAQVFVMFDNITPIYQFRHKSKEVFTWFIQKRFLNVKTDRFNPGYFWAIKQ